MSLPRSRKDREYNKFVDDGSGNTAVRAVLIGGGGGGTPGGNDTELQYNDSGSFGGITGLTTDGDNITIKYDSFLFADDSTNTPYIACTVETVGGIDLMNYADGHLSWTVGGDTLFVRDPNGTTQQTLAMVRAVNTASSLGSFSHIGLNASSAFINYAEFIGNIVSGVAGNEDGSWQIDAMGGGVRASTLNGDKTGINVPIAGTAASPSVRVNSSNSGFYASASNGVALSCNGTQVWRSNSSAQIMNLRFVQSKGANVASSTSMSLGTGGNLFQITGSTTISRISATNWTDGAIITLRLPSGITIEHLSASGSGAQMNLAGSANLTTAATTYITFILDTEWVELYRRVL